MGQKVHPYGFRLGYTKPWKSRWFVERDYDKLLLEDVKLKNELNGRQHHRDRASRQQASRHYQNGASGNHHRPQGR